MCGILGSIHPGIDKTGFQAALNLMQTRGPDAEGIWNEGDVFLGHRRLSIIDTSENANQPFLLGNYITVFNGEIYNYKTLRDELIELGYSFRTTSDTEVLVRSYEAWGEKCSEKLDGMWAFCIYDTMKNTLFFSRDRIGEKPLLYRIKDLTIIFASEMRSMLALMESDEIQPRLEALSQFGIYNFRHIPSPYTPFEDIEKLAPGMNMIYDIQKGEIIKKEKYFSIKKKEIEPDPVDILDTILQKSVEQACYAEVPVGVLLSGGVDSSLVASLMKDRNIMTYSLGWDEYDEEIIRAKAIANHLKLKNTTIYYKEYLQNVNLIDIIKDNITHYGEPINLFQIIYSDILLSHMNKEGIRVVISGNGADELFYGYDGMNTLALMSDVKNIFDTLKLSWIFRFIPRLSFLAEKNTDAKGMLYRKTLDENLFLREEYKNFLYSDILKGYADELPKKSLIEVFSWLGLRVENEHSITLVSDIAGSMEGMEMRTPFLSKEVLEFSANLDTKYKIRSYFSKKENKYILKKVLEKYLPKELVYKKKMGFGYGIRYDNFTERYKNEFSFYFSEILPKIPIYKQDIVMKMFEKDDPKDANTLINILIVCIWWEKFIINQ